MSTPSIRLGVNIDHVATLRQARGTSYPDPLRAAQLAIDAGADQITVHLREDRRHIQEADVIALREQISVPLNLEMATTPEMITFATALKPHWCCLVPEKREELTTEGGLNVIHHQASIKEACHSLQSAGCSVSLFIDPDHDQITAAAACQANAIELHTGDYALASSQEDKQVTLDRLFQAAEYAHSLGLHVHAGHGLHRDNLPPICSMPHLAEVNIGHSLVADALFLGLPVAVTLFKKALHIHEDILA